MGRSTGPGAVLSFVEVLIIAPALRCLRAAAADPAGADGSGGLPPGDQTAGERHSSSGSRSGRRCAGVRGECRWSSTKRCRAEVAQERRGQSAASSRGQQRKPLVEAATCWPRRLQIATAEFAEGCERLGSRSEVGVFRAEPPPLSGKLSPWIFDTRGLEEMIDASLQRGRQG